MDIRGYVIQWADTGRPDEGGLERFEPGSFAACLARKPRVDLVVRHRDDPVLATTRDGTLTVAEDELGLRFDASVDGPLAPRLEADFRRLGRVGVSPKYKVLRERRERGLTVTEAADLLHVSLQIRDSAAFRLSYAEPALAPADRLDPFIGSILKRDTWPAGRLAVAVALQRLRAERTTLSRVTLTSRDVRSRIGRRIAALDAAIVVLADRESALRDLPATPAPRTPRTSAPAGQRVVRSTRVMTVSPTCGLLG